MAGYTYPINTHWEIEEIEKVINMWTTLEKAYEVGVERESVLASYREFKHVVPSKSEEKQLSKAFEEVSGYSLYQTMKTAQGTTRTTLKMGGE